MESKVWVVVLVSSPQLRIQADNVGWDANARVVMLGEGAITVAAFPAEHVRAVYLESHDANATSGV